LQHGLHLVGRVQNFGAIRSFSNVSEVGLLAQNVLAVGKPDLLAIHDSINHMAMQIEPYACRMLQTHRFIPTLIQKQVSKNDHRMECPHVQFRY